MEILLEVIESFYALQAPRRTPLEICFKSDTIASGSDRNSQEALMRHHLARRYFLQRLAASSGALALAGSATRADAEDKYLAPAKLDIPLDINVAR